MLKNINLIKNQENQLPNNIEAEIHIVVESAETIQ